MTADEIARLLPGVYQRVRRTDRVLQGVLDAMEGMLDPVEQAIVGLPDKLDPHRTSDDFVRFIAGWLDIDPALAAGPARLRDLVVHAAELRRLRGTAEGLTLFVTLATGHRPVRRELGAGPFTMTVWFPAAASSMGPLIHRIMQHEKPAHMSVSVRFLPPPLPEG